MSSQLPPLGANGAVTFDSPEAVQSSWETYVLKGALAVKPERALQPLEQLEIYVLGGGLRSPIALKVEVVVLTAERALLRLLEPAPPLPPLPPSPASTQATLTLEPPPPVMSPPDVASEAGPDDAARTESVPLAPSSQSDHGVLAVLEPEEPPARPPPELSLPVPALRTEPAPLPPPPVDDEERMPGPMTAADALPRTSTPFLAMPAPAGLARPSSSATVSPGPPAIELERVMTPAAIALEPIPVAKVLPAVVAEPEPAPISLELVVPPAPAPLAAPVVAPSPAPVAPPPPAPPAPAPAAPQGLPPFFSGDALRFSSKEDFAAGRPHLEGVGAILAVADGRLPTTSVEVRLAVASKETRAKVRVTLAPAAPGTAVVQATERAGFMPLLAELDGTASQRQVPLPSQTMAIPATFAAPAASPASAAASMDAPAAARAFTLPRQGTLENPTTPAGILALPLLKAPSDADIAKPSVPLLLRYLRTTRGVLRLEVTAPDHPLFTAVIVDGREVRTPAALATLGKSLAQPRMSYTITELGRPPQMTTVGRTLHLIAESVRGLIATLDTEELARAFPDRKGLCLRARNDIVQSLGLPAQHTRFIKTDLDGNQHLEEVARAAVGSRTVWETLYVLEIYGGLSWDEPDPNRAKNPAHRTGAIRLSAVESALADDAWAAFDGKDHFAVLGLHWSSSPTEVPSAYQRLRAEYGPGGARRPADTTIADRILKRLEEAYRVLNDTPARQAFRRAQYNLMWPHQAQLLVQKAKLALYRKDYADAKNILLAAEDMASSDEARALLASIKAKLG